MKEYLDRLSFHIEDDLNTIAELDEPLFLSAGRWSIITDTMYQGKQIGCDVNIEKGEIETLRDLVRVVAERWKEGLLAYDWGHCFLEYLLIDEERREIEVWFGS